MKKRGIKSFVILMLLICTFIMQTMVVSASEVKATSTLTISCNTNDASAIEEYVRDINLVSQHLSGTGFDLMTYESHTDVINITFNWSEYRKLDQKDKMALMKTALISVDEYTMSEMSKNKIYNFICKHDESTASMVRQLSNDVNADFARAYSLFKPFSGTVGIILGLFSIIIFVCLTFMVLIDISYIVLPVVRNALTQTEGKPKFVSMEAWYAVKETDASVNEYKSTINIYFKHKISQFVIIGICLLYLLSGKIYLLIGNFMDMLRGFIN